VSVPPILAHKNYTALSSFTPENLLREARRQKRLGNTPVPAVCVLDPDGDIVRYLRSGARARRSASWACYHTDLYEFDHEGIPFGMVGCVVGAPYAVLVAEELFAAGCKFLVSLTSAGQIRALKQPPYFMVIDRALRDEGASYHYLPPSDYSEADPALVRLAQEAFAHSTIAVDIGASWTTDAPFRETQEAIDAAAEQGILAVEMEAAGLYAFAAARAKPVLCVAHVTNQMGLIDGDFEKGAADGAEESLRVISAIASRWLGDQ
jgi:uridine phosphorylase